MAAAAHPSNVVNIDLYADFFEISPASFIPEYTYHLGRGIFVQACLYNKSLKIHVRRYLENNGLLRATKDGVSLTVTDVTVITRKIGKISEALKQLEISIANAGRKGATTQPLTFNIGLSEGRRIQISGTREAGVKFVFYYYDNSVTLTKTMFDSLIKYLSKEIKEGIEVLSGRLRESLLPETEDSEDIASATGRKGAANSAKTSGKRAPAKRPRKQEVQRPIIISDEEDCSGNSETPDFLQDGQAIPYE